MSTATESMHFEDQFIYKGEPITISGVTYEGIMIDKKSRFLNPYEVTLYVSSLPRSEDFIFMPLHTSIEGTEILFSMQNGIVSYFACNPNNRRGYGGTPFELWVIDRHTRKVQAHTYWGPWSSRGSIINKFMMDEPDGEKFQVVDTGFRVRNYKDMYVIGTASYRGVPVNTLLRLLKHFCSQQDIPPEEDYRVVCASDENGEISYSVTDVAAYDSGQTKHYSKTIEAVFSPSCTTFV